MKKFSVSFEEAQDLKKLIIEKYKYLSKFCREKKLCYLWIYQCFKNPEKFGKKTWGKIKKEVMK